MILINCIIWVFISEAVISTKHIESMVLFPFWRFFVTRTFIAITIMQFFQYCIKQYGSTNCNGNIIIDRISMESINPYRIGVAKNTMTIHDSCLDSKSRNIGNLNSKEKGCYVNCVLSWKCLIHVLSMSSWHLHVLKFCWQNAMATIFCRVCWVTYCSVSLLWVMCPHFHL